MAAAAEACRELFVPVVLMAKFSEEANCLTIHRTARLGSKENSSLYLYLTTPESSYELSSQSSQQ